MNNQMLSRRCSKVGGRVEVATCSKTEQVQILEQRIGGSKGRERGADRNASRRPAGTGEEGMGESPAPVQAPRAVAVTGCGEGVNVV